MSPARPCLSAGLDYLSRGWSALPRCPADHQGISGLHEQTCRSPGKAPLIPRKIYQDRLPRENELRCYWQRFPTANVGIVMGPVSGLVGLDVDGEEGEQLLRNLDPLSETLEFTTGHGRRFYTTSCAA